MSESKLIRPSQVTMAGWMIVLGSVIVVVSVFDQIAGLHSIETREAIEKFLSEPPGQGLGLSVNGVEQILRAVAWVAAACATATAILGWHALRRDRSARLGLTVLAVPLFVAGLGTGTFFAALVAAAALTLWSQQARDWFNGVAPAQRPAGLPPAATETRPDPRSAVAHDELPGMSTEEPGWTPPQQPPANPYGSTPGEATPPPYSQPYGQPAPAQQPPTGQPGYPQPYGQQGYPPAYGQQPYGVMGRDPNKRPGTVTAAAIITMILSGLTAVLSFLAVIGMLVAKSDLLPKLRDAIDDPSFTESDLDAVYGVVVAVGVGVVIWSLIAVVLGALLLKRSNVARILLVVSASVASLGSLALITTGVTLVTLAGSIAVIILVFTGGANEWFSRRPAVSGPPPSWSGPPPQNW